MGFSLTGARIAKPKPHDASDADALALYRAARKLDEWEGEEYEGTSVLAGMKAAKLAGWITAYNWCFGERDLAATVSRRGPCVLGVNWYEGMFDTDANGFVHVTGQLLGGHAILCRGYNVKADRYTLRNSWGRAWGDDGDCYVSGADMRRLLSEQGEACFPVEA